MTTYKCPGGHEGSAIVETETTLDVVTERDDKGKPVKIETQTFVVKQRVNKHDEKFWRKGREGACHYCGTPLVVVGAV